MTATIAAFLLYPFVRVSPYVLTQLRALLASSGSRIWKAGYPLAIGIIKDLEDNGKLDGFEKHKAGVQNLKAALVATGKFDAAEIEKQIPILCHMILTAYVNELSSLAK